jgi:hypothetical protein
MTLRKGESTGSGQRRYKSALSGELALAAAVDLI